MSSREWMRVPRTLHAKRFIFDVDLGIIGKILVLLNLQESNLRPSDD